MKNLDLAQHYMDAKTQLDAAYNSAIEPNGLAKAREFAENAIAQATELLISIDTEIASERHSETPNLDAVLEKYNKVVSVTLTPGDCNDWEIAIIAMNEMYKLPVNHTPTLAVGEDAALRLKKFITTLLKEIDEGDLIKDDLERDDEEMLSDEEITKKQLGILTDLADWFADIIVYCMSEARKFGIPLDKVMQCVMGSNFTKLGADGKPIYDENGKFLKGPNFVPPEAAIKELLR